MEKENGSKKKVLLVEDDPFLSDIYLTSLEKSGIETIHANDGNKALLKIKEGGFDLVLLDLLLPGVDGFEVLKNTKSNPETKNIPVVVLSNLMDPEKIKKAKMLGAKEYLLKTRFDPKDIVIKIKNILG